MREELLKHGASSGKLLCPVSALPVMDVCCVPSSVILRGETPNATTRLSLNSEGASTIPLKSDSACYQKPTIIGFSRIWSVANSLIKSDFADFTALQVYTESRSASRARCLKSLTNCRPPSRKIGDPDSLSVDSGI